MDDSETRTTGVDRWRFGRSGLTLRLFPAQRAHGGAPEPSPLDALSAAGLPVAAAD